MSKLFDLLGFIIGKIKEPKSWNDLTDKPFGEVVTLVPVKEFTFTGTNYMYDGLPGISNGDTLRVTFNGEVYDVVYSNGTFGNASIGNSAIADTGEPFYGMYGVLYPREEGTHVVKIEKKETSIKTLDENYIPDVFSGSWNDLTGKPFGEESVEEVVLPECSVELVSNKYVEGYTGSVTPDEFVPLVGGVEYTVIIDGQPYQSTAVEESWGVLLRDVGGFSITSFPSTNEYEVSGDSAGTHTFKITTTATVVKPLDEIYIPDTIARTEDIPKNGVNSVNNMTGDVVLDAASVGALPDSTEIPAVPASLPNPNTLTFTGAVMGSYDGSAPLNVEIPAANDADWEFITKLTQEGTTTNYYISQNDSGEAFSYDELAMFLTPTKAVNYWKKVQINSNDVTFSDATKLIFNDYSGNSSIAVDKTYVLFVRPNSGKGYLSLFGSPDLVLYNFYEPLAVKAKISSFTMKMEVGEGGTIEIYGR